MFISVTFELTTQYKKTTVFDFKLRLVLVHIRKSIFQDFNFFLNINRSQTIWSGLYKIAYCKK